MRNYHYWFNLPMGLIGVLAGGFLAGLVLEPSAKAQTLATPCPRIYYEAPFTMAILPPAGCPANAVGQVASSLPVAPQTAVSSATPSSNDALPVPEVFQNPATTIALNSGRVSIQLVNDTNVPVVYSVMGDTEQRLLPANSTTTLIDLVAPIEMTFHRQDTGFVMAMPQSLTPGTLQLTLDETADFDASDGGVIVQANGDVVIN